MIGEEHDVPSQDRGDGHEASHGVLASVLPERPRAPVQHNRWAGYVLPTGLVLSAMFIALVFRPPPAPKPPPNTPLAKAGESERLLHAKHEFEEGEKDWKAGKQEWWRNDDELLIQDALTHYQAAYEVLTGHAAPEELGEPEADSVPTGHECETAECVRLKQQLVARIKTCRSEL